MSVSEISGNWNLDHVWFTKAEARALLPAKPKVGDKQEWPRPQIVRLARFHLIDSVNGLRYGQRPMFKDEEVQKASMATVVDKVEGDVVTVHFEGHTLASTQKPLVRGCDSELLGTGTFNLKTGRFTAFDLVGLTSRWGGTGGGKSNDRKGEVGPQPLGFTFSLSGDSPMERVPPMYVLGYNW